jgi:methionyl-tRNA synthetase
MPKFYVTTSIVYTNGNPHLGFAMEITQADVLARFHRLLLDGTYFLTGTDEHGLKIYQTALKENISTQEFVDSKANRCLELTKALNLSNNDFVRTTDQQKHWPGVIKLWNTLVANGDIYKKKYQGLYSVRAERFVTQKELDEDHGQEHSQIIELEEENYFFALSKYQTKLYQLISSDTLKITPLSKKNEILTFINEGLEDISWGIPVPDDDGQVMYVWCDALTNYISALGYGGEADDLFKTFWPADVHVIGKDIIRFHAVYWPAMLMSADLALPKNLFVHGFINVDGQKMSKSIGNVIDPFSLIENYGTDAFRYYFLREIPTTGDGDYSQARFINRYNDDLANGLGNLVARVAKLCENSTYTFHATTQSPQDHLAYCQYINNFELNRALEYVWTLIKAADQKVDSTKPWKLEGQELKKVLAELVNEISTIAMLLEPFLPATSLKILTQYNAPQIHSAPALFPRVGI